MTHDASDDQAVMVRHSYRAGAEAFLTVVIGLAADAWTRPALPGWSVLDLAGHTSRSLITVENYLDPLVRAAEVELASAGDYYRAARTELADAGAVLERGRQAGRALGDDPAGAAAAIVHRVLGLVDQAPDDALVRTPVGTMTLATYLRTRVFELAVHTLDLCTATGAEVPVGLRGPADGALPVAIKIAVEIAVDRGDAPHLLLALTGRQPLPAGFSVV